MPVVQAEFDGRVFVPRQPVCLPVGTTVDIVVPGLTPEEEHEWKQIVQQLASSEPYFPTVEEAIRYSRKRP